ncbi:methyl-accepting chemotaxis protein [Kineococcus sp. G2]|uniref:methyl-accepting chemotaxis protein n=1 Tax=Kineococcus sp. G2 TaxID=3127484 RepID=UPI00301C5C5E
MTLLSALPRGARLSPESAAARHRINTTLLWLHVPALWAVGLGAHRGALTALLVGAVPGVFGALAAAASRSRPGQVVPAAHDLTSVGLFSATFVLIELTGGTQAAHFHLFVILVFIALYQSWRALAAAVVTAAVHHVVIGVLFPERVFHTHVHGLQLAGLVGYHVGVLVLEIIGILFLWHFAEAAERESERVAEEAARERTRAAEAQQLAAQEQVEAERRRREQLAAITASLAEQASGIERGAAESNRAVENVEGQLAALSAAVREVAERAQQAARTATSGQQAADAAAGTVQQLESSMTEISAVNAVIGQLAGQTNLLSLNATIEAARAGELGKGFAVVASEVKELATETAASADKVNTVIAAVVAETGAVAASCAATSEVVGRIQGIQAEIAGSVEEQATVVVEVARELSNAAAATRGILDALQELSATAATLER